MVIDARPATAAIVRMVPKFINGIHTVFDKVYFDHGPQLPTAKVAAETADMMNANLNAPKVQANRASARR